MTSEVCLRVEGMMPEKLIQRALAMSVTFGEIRRPDARTLIVWVSAADAKRMTKLCRRFSIPVKIVSRRGGSALMKALRRRWTLMPGLALGALIGRRLFLLIPEKVFIPLILTLNLITAVHILVTALQSGC